MHRGCAGILIAAGALACGGSTTDDPGPAGGSGGSGGAVAGAGGSAGAAGATGGASGKGGSSGAAAGGGAAGAGGAGACFDAKGSIPSTPFKLCQSASDCEIATHTADCCGSQVKVGVRKDQLTAFAACELAWVETLPSCGCASQGERAEDGKSSLPPAVVEVACVDFTSQGGICKTRVP